MGMQTVTLELNLTDEQISSIAPELSDERLMFLPAEPFIVQMTATREVNGQQVMIQFAADVIGYSARV